VAEALAEAINLAPADARVLTFTFKDDEGRRRKRRTPLTTLRDNLTDLGVDLESVLGAGKLRAPILTWGQETSLNSFADCKHLAIAGAPRRDTLGLAACFAGESNDLTARSSIPELSLSEVAASVLQAIHRGNCRRVDGTGQAGEMTVTIIDRGAGLRELLEQEMPGVNWIEIRPSSSLAPSRTMQAQQAVIDHLATLPLTKMDISSDELKRAAVAASGLTLGADAWTEAIKGAVSYLGLVGAFSNPEAGQWKRVRRRLARVSRDIGGAP
jgi:hypothetical protein